MRTECLITRFPLPTLALLGSGYSVKLKYIKIKHDDASLQEKYHAIFAVACKLHASGVPRFVN